MRILTWNIHGARDAPPARIAQEIRARSADVVCLNEVQRGHAKRLARMTGMRISHAICSLGPYGNAILTSESVASTRRLHFTGVRRVDRRDALILQLASGLHVAVVHLNLRAPQRLADFRELLQALPDRSILAGDLNETPGGVIWSEASSRFLDACEGTATFPAVKPRARIDYIWVPKDAHVVQCRVIPTEASDHRAVFADVSL